MDPMEGAVTLFDDADALLRDALAVSAHARPLDGRDRIEPGDLFVATVTVENQGVGDDAGTAARTAFVDVIARVEATPFASPVHDEQPVRDTTLELGELIFGEATSRDVTMRALAAMDGPEPFARVHVRGRLDVERFFTAASVHQFSTEIRRPVAQDAAADAFRTALLSDVLPDGFHLESASFDVDDDEAFRDLVDDPDRFRHFVRERVIELAEGRGLASAAVQSAANLLPELYLDVHQTGYTGALALALWFVGFDQGESFSFAEVRAAARDYLSVEAPDPATSVWDARRELRLFKGFPNDGVLADPITVSDLPVVVDYGRRTVTLWAGSLRA